MNDVHPTPFYQYDVGQIRKQYRQFSRAIPKVKVRYALKCNPRKEVIEALDSVASGFEVASKDELSLLLAGDVGVSRIFFSNPVKVPSHIQYAFKKGVRVFAFDSPEEIEKIAFYAPGSSVFLRLRVYERGSVFSLKDKFGVEARQVPMLARLAQEAGLHFYGLSFHVGSQALKVNAWKHALEKIVKVKSALGQKGITLQALDLGGGFPYPYASTQAPNIEEIGQVIRTYTDALNLKALYAEPGRYLVANSASLTASIIHRTVRGGKTWLYLDAGTYNALFESMQFQGSIQYRAAAVGQKRTSGRLQQYVLAGPTCDSIDTIHGDISLPADLGIGDRIIFYDVGAYTNALANSFNGFKPPKAYF